jgi:hypothetical protein
MLFSSVVGRPDRRDIVKPGIRRRDRLAVLATLATLASAACSDLTAPLASAPDAGPTPSLATISGTDGSTAYQHVLRQSPSAPALEKYQASFYAVRGSPRSIEIRYQSTTSPTRIGDRYVRFTVPDGALVTDAAGNKLRRGDSVLVTLRLDPVDFQVDFEPSGLTFSRSAPALLDIWYQNADPDANRDGVVDGADQYVFEQFLSVYHYDTKGNSIWSTVSSSNDKKNKVISAPIEGFSGYAICW